MALVEASVEGWRVKGSPQRVRKRLKTSFLCRKRSGSTKTASQPEGGVHLAIERREAVRLVGVHDVRFPILV